MDRKILVPRKQPGEKIYINEHGNFVVEWCEYADDNDALADPADMLVVDDARLAALVAHPDLPSDVDRQRIADVLAERFDSQFQVRRYLNESKLPHTRAVEFRP